MVTAPNARFTVLTSRLLRLEFSPSGEFEDHPSQAFWYREQPVPAFTVERSPERIEIRTEHLQLNYLITPAGFSAETLSVEVFATGAVWHFGTSRNRANLKGTARTLDGADGAVRLDPGLMSRQGWALVDDSQTLVFQ